ncbi:hypothetical protein ACFL4G_04305 [Thermodesulfobacteriota bacterium]
MGSDFDEFYLDYLMEGVRAVPDQGLTIMVEPEKLGLTEDFIKHWTGKKCPDCGTPLERREYVISHHVAGHFDEVSE